MRSRNLVFGRAMPMFAGILAVAMIATAAIAAMQDDAAQDSAGQNAAQQDAGQSSAEQEYDKLFAEWRTKLDALRRLQVEYKQAPPQDQQRIEREFDQLLTEATEMSVRLQGLVEAAFKANPKDEEKADFLFSIAYEQYKQDNFEEAARLCDILLETEYKSKAVVLDLAAQCAYLVNDYAKAEELIKQAEVALSQAQRPLAAETQAMKRNLELDRKAWNEELAFREADAKPEGDPMALPRVELETSQGKIVLELFENEAPNTVANFISLVKKGFYDGLKFHRVIGGFMAQGGDPNGDGSGGPGYSIPFESHQEPYRKHFRGVIAMAHGDSKDSGGSQFYIVFRRDQSRHLDGVHTVFGRVVEGMDVVSKFARLNPESQETTIPNPDRIIKVTVLNARDHEYEPRKVGDPTPPGNAGDGDANKTGDAGTGGGDAGTGGAGNGAGGNGGGDAGNGGTGNGGGQ